MSYFYLCLWLAIFSLVKTDFIFNDYGQGNYGHGVGNIVNGVNNNWIGDMNKVDGNQNKIQGNTNKIDGQSNSVNGNGNFVQGDGNVISGEASPQQLKAMEEMIAARFASIPGFASFDTSQFFQQTTKETKSNSKPFSEETKAKENDKKPSQSKKPSQKQSKTHGPSVDKIAAEMGKKVKNILKKKREGGNTIKITFQSYGKINDQINPTDFNDFIPFEETMRRQKQLLDAQIRGQISKSFADHFRRQDFSFSNVIPSSI